MLLRENYIYENTNLVMTIYQDKDNPKQWMINVLNWSKGTIDTMRITKRKAQSLLDNDKRWVETTQEKIDKSLAKYLGVKSMDEYWKRCRKS